MEQLRNNRGLLAVLVIVVAALVVSIPGFIAGPSTPESRTAHAASTSEEPPIQAYELDQSAVASIATCDEVAKVIDAFVNDPDPWIPQGGSESSVGLQLDQRSAELCQAEVTQSPSPTTSAPGPTPETTASPSPTATPPIAEISEVSYRTWAELIANPPRGLSDAINANRKEGNLAWGWADVERWAALEDSPVAIIELVQDYSEPTSGEYPVRFATGCRTIAGSDGCPDPGQSRFVLSPLDPSGGLVPGTGITRNGSGGMVIITY